MIPNRSQYHVIEQMRALPAFGMYVKADPNELQAPQGYVSFTVNGRVPRIVIWINNNFILAEDYAADGNISIAFIAIRTNLPVIIKMEANGQITFQTDDMELAGLLVPSLVSFLNLGDLQVTCDFPLEIENLQETLIKVRPNCHFFIKITRYTAESEFKHT